MRIISPYQELPTPSARLLRRRNNLVDSNMTTSTRDTSRSSGRMKKAMMTATLGCIGMAMMLVLFVSLTSSSPTEETMLLQRTTTHRHPFVPPRVRRRSLFSSSSAEGKNSEPRYLVFGTSSTFGVGLEDPAKEAYSHQLSATAHNAATQSGGFTLAAACTQSIVRENVYDVIVIEFTEWDLALSILSKRLRQRFPNAFLVFLRLWHPSQLKYRQTNGTSIDFHEFRRANGNCAMDDPELYLKVLASKERWSFSKPQDETIVLDEAARNYASYFAMNIPDSDLFEYPKTMMDQLSIFQDYSDDLNAQGHAVVAASLRSVMQGHKLSAERNKVGTWGLGDECRLWYENGLYHSEQESKRLKRVEFSKAGGVGSDWFVNSEHKHALEIDNVQGSVLEIENPFKEDRMLYLTYLTTPMDQDSDETKQREEAQDQRPPKGDDYPQLRLRINERPAIIIEAMHNSVQQEELARTSAVGSVPPGRSVVHLDPLVASSNRAFRLLGWSLLPQELEGQLEWEYSLEQSRLPAQDYWNWFGSSTSSTQR